jgi:TatA/E family protein of Tat protein translocase
VAHASPARRPAACAACPPSLRRGNFSGRYVAAANPTPNGEQARRLDNAVSGLLRPRNAGKLGRMPFGPIELILILVIIVFLFGASRLPKMGRGLGQGLRGFKRELSEGLDGDEETEDRRDREAVSRAYERQ